MQAQGWSINSDIKKNMTPQTTKGKAMEKATDLKGIRKQCRLGPLTGEELDKWWVETDDARDPKLSMRGKIKQMLDEQSDSRILVYGHGGCGKSTELNKLVQELGEDYVSFSILDEMSAGGGGRRHRPDYHGTAAGRARDKKLKNSGTRLATLIRSSKKYSHSQTESVGKHKPRSVQPFLYRY